MGEEAKRKLTTTVDFVTALPLEACHERLQQDTRLTVRGLAAWLAPVSQSAIVHRDHSFTIERTFPGAIHPIRLAGHLDPAEGEGGTWVHGTVTHDTYNQVLIEGLILFFLFFVFSALFFLRFRVEGFCLSVPLFMLVFGVFSLRWRILKATTEDTAHWLRRKLYVTARQVKG